MVMSAHMTFVCCPPQPYNISFKGCLSVRRAAIVVDAVPLPHYGLRRPLPHANDFTGRPDAACYHTNGGGGGGRPRCREFREWGLINAIPPCHAPLPSSVRLFLRKLPPAQSHCSILYPLPLAAPCLHPVDVAYLDARDREPGGASAGHRHHGNPRVCNMVTQPCSPCEGTARRVRAVERSVTTLSCLET